MNRFIKKIKFNLISTLVILLSISVNAVAKDIGLFLNNNGYKSINLKNINGYLYADGLVSDRPMTAIVDTGSNGISITPNSLLRLKELKMTPYKTGQKSMNSDGKVTFDQGVTLHNLTIGNVRIKETPAKILDLSFNNKLPTLVIGIHFLRKYHAIIDTYNNKMYLSFKGLSKENKFEFQNILQSDKFHKISLMAIKSGQMLIPISINNKRSVSFLFDTGTGITLISRDYAKSLKEVKKNKGEVKTISINSITMNPLNTYFQDKVVIEDVTAQIENLSSMTKYLDVLGIVGLPQMIKGHTIIVTDEDTVYMKSS